MDKMMTVLGVLSGIAWTAFGCWVVWYILWGGW